MKTGRPRKSAHGEDWYARKNAAAKRYYADNRADVLLRRALARGLGAEAYEPGRDRARYERQRMQRLIYGQLQYLLRTDMEKNQP